MSISWFWGFDLGKRGLHIGRPISSEHCFRSGLNWPVLFVHQGSKPGQPLPASIRPSMRQTFFCIFQTCLALKRAFQPGTKYVFKTFSGERGCPWYGPSAPPGRHFAMRTLGYKRAFGAGTRYASFGFFGAFLGQRGGTRVAPGTVPLRNPKGTSRKACLENPDFCN